MHETDRSCSIFCLVGPTASGKTEIAVSILESLQGVIISADARQVYRFLDIGTNKPDPELQRRVRFEMIDRVLPEQIYSAAEFARDAIPVIRNLLAERRPFMIVGGSGLYVKALFEPFFAVPRTAVLLRQELARVPVTQLYRELRAIDPQTADRLHPNDRQRIMRALEIVEATGKTVTQLRQEHQQEVAAVAQTVLVPCYVGLSLPYSLLYRRIDERFDAMLARGFIDEVRNLTRMGYDEKAPALSAIGYRELLLYLNNALTLDEAVRAAKKRSRAYARRQMTWFRHQPGIRWIDSSDRDAALEEVRRLFQNSGSCFWETR